MPACILTWVHIQSDFIPELGCRGVGRSSKGAGPQIGPGALYLTFPKYDLLLKRLFLFSVQGEKCAGDDTLALVPLPSFPRPWEVISIIMSYIVGSMFLM